MFAAQPVGVREVRLVVGWAAVGHDVPATAKDLKALDGVAAKIVIRGNVPVAVVEIVVGGAGDGTLHPSPQAVVGVTGRGRSAYRHQPVLRVVAVIQHSGNWIAESNPYSICVLTRQSY